MAISTLEATQREHFKLITVCLSFDHDFELYMKERKQEPITLFPGQPAQPYLD